MWKKVYDKVVRERGCRKVKCEKWCGERWYVTIVCVKDGVVKDGAWQSGVWRMGWWKMVRDKVLCERWCEKNGKWKMVCERSCMAKLYVIKMAYDKMKVDVAKCHACHAKRRWMISPSTRPITQNEGGCYQVPRLPHKTKVDITKYPPRLPRKVPQRYWRPIQSMRATRASPMPAPSTMSTIRNEVPHLMGVEERR